MAEPGFEPGTLSFPDPSEILRLTAIALHEPYLRFLEVAERRGPPPNVVGRHAVVVVLWWAKRMPEREQDSERSNSSGREEKGVTSCLLIRTPNIL